MANYNSTQITGESWQRCKRVIIENQYNQVPQILFMEERKFPIGVDVYGTVEVGCLQETLASPMTEFEMLDIDGLPTGVMKTYLDIYLTMNSLYMSLANLRDNPTPFVPPEEPPVFP